MCNSSGGDGGSRGGGLKTGQTRARDKPGGGVGEKGATWKVSKKSRDKQPTKTITRPKIEPGSNGGCIVHYAKEGKEKKQEESRRNQGRWEVLAWESGTVVR